VTGADSAPRVIVGSMVTVAVCPEHALAHSVTASAAPLSARLTILPRDLRSPHATRCPFALAASVSRGVQFIRMTKGVIHNTRVFRSLQGGRRH